MMFMHTRADSYPEYLFTAIISHNQRLYKRFDTSTITITQTTADIVFIITAQNNYLGIH